MKNKLNFNIKNLHEHIGSDTKEILLKLLEDKSNADKFIDQYELLEMFKEDKDVLKAVLSQCPSYISFLYFAQNDIELIEVALDSGLEEVKLIDPGLLTNKELMLKFVIKNPENLLYLPLSLKNDIDLAIHIDVSNYSDFIRGTQLSNNIDYHLQLIEKDPDFYFEMHSLSFLKKNKQLICSYIEQCEICNHTPFIGDEVLKYYEVENTEELLDLFYMEHLENKINTNFPNSTTNKPKKKI